MPRVNIPFGDFLPSQPDFNNPGCIVANNCRPHAGGSYGPSASATSTDIRVEGRVLSSQQFFNAEGVSVTAGGGTNFLFLINDTGQVMQVHPPITEFPSSESWQFEQFNNLVIGTASGNSPKYLADINNAMEWLDLPGDPPRMSRIGRVSEFLILGNAANNPSQIAWSSFNNPTASWTPDRLSQAGTATLPTQFGRVQAITGGRYALIFQERAIQRITYIGPPTTWRIDPISEQRGLLAPLAIAEVGYLVYFLAQDGFFVSNGSEFFPIGNERINQWFFDTVDQAELPSTQAIVDFSNRSIIWTFKTQTGPFNRCLVYSWLYDRWSTLDHIFLSPVSATIAENASLDQDPLGSMSLDDEPLASTSLDSSEFRAQNLITSLWREDGTTHSRLFQLNGTSLQANWETGEFEPAPAQRVFIDEVYPVIDDSSWSAQSSLVIQDNLGRETASLLAGAGVSGFSPVRGEGKRARIRIQQPAGSTWSDAQGVQVNYQVAGIR